MSENQNARRTQPQRDNRGGGRGPNQRFGRRPRGRDGQDKQGEDNGPELFEKVIYINRSSKVVKGGRRFNFSALVVVGDREGKVGLGFGKATEVVSAIKKGSENARKEMEPVSLRNDTIPHEVHSIYDGANILLKPACQGTGVIAGKVVRSVLDAAGVSNVLSKSLGSKNAANVAKATLQALKQLKLKKDIYAKRGMEVRVATPAEAAPVAVESSTQEA
ncbi:MAG: 30S ribosomal protein S5 [Verrucomicrobiota bacterium]